MNKRLVTLAASAALIATAAAAQEGVSTARHTAAQNAGYIALHYCTGTFASTMSPETVRDTNRRVAAGEISIDREARTVSVPYADNMPPRMAVWRPVIGCTQLPIGATDELARALPRLPETLHAPNFDDQPWPMGDVGAEARLPAAKSAAVEAVIDQAFKDEAGPYSGQTWGVVIVKDGKIVAERYDPGFGPHVNARTNSMCKSLGSTLVGMGVKRGWLDIHAKAPLKEWRRPGDPRGQITLNDMLHMASGLYTDAGGNPQGDLYGSGAAAAEISALNMVDSRPGDRFLYAGSDTILSVRAVREAVDDDTAWMAWPYKELLWKLGMTRTIMEMDWNGDFLSSGQCWSTARDFGRFGLFYLNNGAWNGEQLLPTNWAEYVATPAPAQPASAARGGGRYGGQFWLYGGNAGLPDVAYTPAGAQGQYAMIIPSKNVVVVRRGLDGAKGFEIAQFSADILKALE